MALPTIILFVKFSRPYIYSLPYIIEYSEYHLCSFSFSILNICNRIAFLNYHTFTILIKSWPSCKLLCFSFYFKVSVAHVILSKEDVKTTRSEWSLEDFCLWHLLSFVPFLKVSLDRKLLKIIQT